MAKAQNRARKNSNKRKIRTRIVCRGGYASVWNAYLMKMQISCSYAGGASKANEYVLIEKSKTMLVCRGMLRNQVGMFFNKLWKFNMLLCLGYAFLEWVCFWMKTWKIKCHRAYVSHRFVTQFDMASTTGRNIPEKETHPKWRTANYY